jgi:hypothetical protein
MVVGHSRDSGRIVIMQPRSAKHCVPPYVIGPGLARMHSESHSLSVGLTLLGFSLEDPCNMCENLAFGVRSNVMQAH